jgi:hypothetical protein
MALNSVDSDSVESYPAAMIRRSFNRQANRAIVASCALATACGGDFESDYDLNLVPYALVGQDPFSGDRVLELVIGHVDGTTEMHYLGLLSGEPTVDQLPPIPAGGWVGVLIEDAGGAPAEYDESQAVAWGVAQVPEGLATGEGKVTLDILLAEIGKVGDLNALNDNKARFHPAGAMLSSGAVYLFGGSDSTNGGVALDDILKLAATDSEKWLFSTIDKTLPLRDGLTGRYGAAAIVVEVNGAEQIYVTGGRGTPDNFPGNETTDGLLFDPLEDKFTYGDKTSHTGMAAARAEHGMLLLDSGKVLIYGGFGTSNSLGVEIFNPKNQKYDHITTTTHGSAYPSAAGLGNEGAMVCGGGTFDNAGGATIPTENCDTVTLQGLVTPGPSLPTPTLGLAMAELADGRILATGGVTTEVTDNSQLPATNQAWMYKNGNWNTLAGEMAVGRAHHRIVALPNGDAIIVGGTEVGGAVFPVLGPAVNCPELFDARAGTFEPLPCTNAGAGAHPIASAVANEGAFVFAGEDITGDDELGDAYGYIGFHPPL